jgi:hypothetical protein
VSKNGPQPTSIVTFWLLLKSKNTDTGVSVYCQKDVPREKTHAGIRPFEQSILDSQLSERDLKRGLDLGFEDFSLNRMAWLEKKEYSVQG